MTHPALCPRCDQLADREVIHEYGRIIEAHYVCPDGHGWQTKWVKEVAV